MSKGSDERWLAAAGTIEARVANYVWAVRAGTQKLEGKKEKSLKRDKVYTGIIKKHRAESDVLGGKRF